MAKPEGDRAASYLVLTVLGAVFLLYTRKRTEVGVGITQLHQLGFSIAAVSYAIGVVVATKFLFTTLRQKGVPAAVAIYFDRKIVHIAGGGVVALLIPVLFDSPLWPLAIGLALSLFTSLPHVLNKRLEWMQVPQNWNDVKFTFFWGLTIFVIWTVTGSPRLAVIPALFMSFGDGVTGIVRNVVFRRRTKHPIGNVFMLLVCVPLAVWMASPFGSQMIWWGIGAAACATVVERFEFPPIDDNILIAATASAVLLLGAWISL
ncbi:hypothetical protein ACFLS5_01340 [Candidatus Bipolaricaulota bacterium]